MPEKPRILLVDDEPSVTKVLSEFLVRMDDYEVRCVNDPASALEAALEFKPHLIVLDIVMPGIDGGELLAQIRERTELVGLPVIFLTGLVGEDEISVWDHRIGGCPVLAKPVPAARFRRVVHQQLSA